MSTLQRARCMSTLLQRSQVRRIAVAVLVGVIVCILVVYSKDHYSKDHYSKEDEEKSVAQINEERLQHLREVCERTNNGGKKDIETSFYMHIKNESLLYCLVFKSGTTSWFYNINRWAGYTSDEILDQKADNFFLARQRYPWENAKVLHNTMKNTRSFIVVRNPFLRLISAYEERLLEQIHPYFTNLSHQIYKKYHNDGVEVGIPSFQDFVQFVIDMAREKKTLDLHWRPINDLCTPCLARYDFIMKLETFAEDLNYFSNQTQLQHKIKPVQMNHSRRDKVNRLIEKYFSQITRQQFFDLFAVYMIDFELFNYSTDGYLQHTMP